MTGDPARRPSNERVAVAGSIGSAVWVECDECLGDGWFYPRNGRRNRKITCGVCHGQGRRQTLAIYCGPKSRIVAGPSNIGEAHNDD